MVGGVSLVKGRVKEAGPVMREVCDDELELMLQDIGFLDEVPFKTINMIIRFGDKDDLTPKYDPINKRHSELPVAVELELAGLKIASKDVVKATFVTATLGILLDISEKYKCFKCLWFCEHIRYSRNAKSSVYDVCKCS